MTPLLPVALGALVAGLVSRLGDAETLPVAATVLWAVALAAFSFVVSATAARVGTSLVLGSDSSRVERAFLGLVVGKWLVLLTAYAALLEQGGLVTLAESAGSLAEGPLGIGPWVVACFAAWLGHDVGETAAIVARGGVPRTRFRELRGKPRRVLVPLALLLALATGLELLAGLPGVGDTLAAHPHARSLAGALSVLAIFALGPLLLRVLFPTRRIEAPLIVEGERLPRFRLWDLGSPVATASVAGLLPGARTIFVTPRLLSLLLPEEGAAVIRHELGHAVLGHLTAIGLAASAYLVLLDELSPFLEHHLSEELGALVWLLLLGVTFVAFALLARRLEHDADLYAGSGGREASVVAALIRVCEANGQPPEKNSVRHPSVARRVALLERSAREPGLAARRLGRSRLLLLGIGGAALLVLGQAAVRAVIERPVVEAEPKKN